jgi:hypothetical protein
MLINPPPPPPELVADPPFVDITPERFNKNPANPLSE